MQGPCDLNSLTYNQKKKKNCQSESSLFFLNGQYLLLDELEADLGQGGALIRMCGVVSDLPGPHHGFAVVFGPQRPHLQPEESEKLSI